MRPKLRREKARRARSRFCSIFRQTDLVPLSSWWCVGEDGQAERSQATAPCGARCSRPGAPHAAKAWEKDRQKQINSQRGGCRIEIFYLVDMGAGAGGWGPGAGSLRSFASDQALAGEGRLGEAVVRVGAGLGQHVHHLVGYDAA